MNDDILHRLTSISERFNENWLREIEEKIRSGQLEGGEWRTVNERDQFILELCALPESDRPTLPPAVSGALEQASRYLGDLAPSLMNLPLLRELAATVSSEPQSTLGDPFDDIRAVRVTPSFLVSNDGALVPLVRVDMEMVGSPALTLSLQAMDVHFLIESLLNGLTSSMEAARAIANGSAAVSAGGYPSADEMSAAQARASQIGGQVGRDRGESD